MRKRVGSLHRPPPRGVVDALVQAGLTRQTAASMEQWKALEVLELLAIPAHLIIRRGDEAC
jgi:hypothetical protein